MGVSERWYASFESGTKERCFSLAFIHRVAGALFLNEADRVWLFRLALPEAAAVAEHFEVSLARAENARIDAQATAGHALASAIFRRVTAQETLRETRAAAGQAVASAIYSQLLAQESTYDSQAAVGRTLAASICQRLLDRE